MRVFQGARAACRVRSRAWRLVPRGCVRRGDGGKDGKGGCLLARVDACCIARMLIRVCVTWCSYRLPALEPKP